MNLDAVLFAVSDDRGRGDGRAPDAEAAPEAIISVPPFKIVGTIHLLPTETTSARPWSSCTGRFLPVTDATYWSDTLGEARQHGRLVAVNHRRAQILAPHREVDPWAGIDPTPGQPRPRRLAARPDYDPTNPTTGSADRQPTAAVELAATPRRPRRPA